MDFNGVIINDELLQMKAYQEVFKAEGIELTEEGYFSCTGMDDATFIREHFRRANKDINDLKVLELTQKKTEKWREAVGENVPLFDGIENFIKKCRKRYAMALVSMANREEIFHILDVTGLRDQFDVVVTAESVNECKPNPEAYINAFRQLDEMRSREGHYPLERHECLVVEDVPQGIQAGKAAGMKTLAVLNTFDEATMRAAGADAIAKNINDWYPESIDRVFDKN
jgi:haloacid dehalogenase superfamily, subfamily IA, variant 3 with third motif having DD or ED